MTNWTAADDLPGPWSPDIGTELLIEELYARNPSVGTLISYDEMQAITGRTKSELQSILRTVRRRLMKRRHFYRARYGKGWERIDNSGMHEEFLKSVRKQNRMLERTLEFIRAIPLDELPADMHAEVYRTANETSLQLALGQDPAVRDVLHAWCAARGRGLTRREQARLGKQCQEFMAQAGERFLSLEEAAAGALEILQGELTRITK
jgi:hypothetical protein